ncbi:MAG: hypothetical protein ICV60_14720 [Pyrinomonadaceae bacterium]|nr:hypothetical protein [Pyrinomonadaceae bacterium]
MKRIQTILLACLIALAASNVYGQTRRRTTSGRRSRPASTRNQSQSVSAATVAARVAEQIKSIGRFLYLYGPIWKELAANEALAQQSSATIDALQRNKAKLREAFHNYRVQMDELETTFSSSSELRPYYTKLLGVAASAGQAEDAVAASRYDQAGRSLLDVMNRLTDALVDMQSR